MGSKKRTIEETLEKLGDNFEINWNKTISGANSLPLILLNRSKDAIYKRDYFSAKRILENYIKLEEVFHSENIPHDEKMHEEFLKQKKILKLLKKNGYYFEIQNKDYKRAYE